MTWSRQTDARVSGVLSARGAARKDTVSEASGGSLAVSRRLRHWARRGLERDSITSQAFSPVAVVSEITATPWARAGIFFDGRGGAGGEPETFLPGGVC